MKKFISLSIFFLIIFSCQIHAATYWWKPQLASTSFTTASNWVTGLGCGTTIATSAPGSNDDVNFTSCGTGNCHIDGNVTVNSITIASSYTGTVSINTGKTFTFKSGSFKGGTFTASDGAVTCNKDITIDGTSFTSTSGNFTVNGDFTYKTGGFTHNSGKVIFQHGTQAGRRTISSTANLVTVSFYKVEFAAPDSNTQFDVANVTIEVNNQLKISGSHQVFLNTSTSSVIKAKGDILSINSSSVGGGTATIEVTGTANQALNDNSGSNPSGKLPNMKINKSGGTLTLQGNIGMGGSTKWEYTAGTVDAGTSKVMCYYSNTLKNSSAATMSFYDLEIMGLGDQDIIDGTVQVTHIFTTSYKGLCVINAASGGGRLELQGDVHWYNQNATSFGNATFKFTGSNSQAISDSIEAVFYNMEINKSGGSVTLQGPLSVSNNLNLVGKNLVTDTTNILTLKNGATISNGSSSSFVSGPMKKIGNSAFTFPVGKSTYYKPVNISAPSSTTDAFRAEYFNAQQLLGSSKDSLTYISTCEYWYLKRTTGSSSVKVKLYWDNNTCDIYTLQTLRVGRWDGSKWNNAGMVTTSGTTSSGNEQTNSSLSSFGYFLIAKRSPVVYAHAGIDKTVCNGSGTSIGGSPTASGGVSPYTYLWSPANGLSSSTTSNPTATVTENTVYIVTVKDVDLTSSKDTMVVIMDKIPIEYLGSDRIIQYGKATTLGGSPTAWRGVSPYSYSWSPSTSLNSSSTSNPVATPISSTTYSLTVTDNLGCQAQALNVKVSVIPFTLGVAENFALLATDSIISQNSFQVKGKIGTDIYVSGNITATDSILHHSGSEPRALSDLAAAMQSVDQLTATTINNQLGGITLTSGNYRISGDAYLDGILKISGGLSSVFIIDIDDSLFITKDSRIDLEGVMPDQIFIRVGSSVIGEDSIDLKGTFLVSGDFIAQKILCPVCILCQSNIKVYSISAAGQLRDLRTIITIDFDNSVSDYNRTIPIDFLGYNGQDIDHKLTWSPVSDPLSVRNALPKLQASLFRYPGGGISNAWDWKQGWYLPQDQVPDFCAQCNNCPFCGYYESYWGLPILSGDKLISDAKNAINYANAGTLMNLNMVTSNLGYQLEWLYDSKCKGSQIKYIELGNELYDDSPKNNIAFPTAHSYALAANTWINAIRLTFGDNVKIAITGASLKENAYDARRNTWCSGLGLPGLAQFPYVDAITFHHYIDCGVPIPDNNDFSNSDLSVFFVSPFHSMDYLKSNTLNVYMPSNQNSSGEDVEAWITEYNLSAGPENNFTFNTWAQGLFTAAMTLAYLEDKRITHAICHAMLSTDRTGLFDDADDDINHVGGGDPVYPNLLELGAQGNALSLIGKAMNGNDVAKKLSFPGASMIGTSNYPSLYGWYFENSSSSSNKNIIILNLSAGPITIDLSNNAFSSLNSYETMEGYTSIFFGFNNPFELVRGDFNPLGTKGVLYAEGNGNSLVVPPYSITRVYQSCLALNLTASSTSVCVNEPVTFTASCSCGIATTLWWFIPTGPVYANGVMNYTPTTAGSFTVMVEPIGCPNTCGDPSSKSVTIQVNNTTTLSIVASPSTICNGGSADLTGTSGLSAYVWSPSTDLSSATGNPVTASPSETTTYTLLGTINNCSCSNIATTTVSVTAADAGDDLTVCSGQPVIIGPKTPNPANAHYQWYRGTSLIFGANNYNYTATETLSGISSEEVVYKVVVDNLGMNCPLEEDEMILTVLDCCSNGNVVTFNPDQDGTTSYTLVNYPYTNVANFSYPTSSSCFTTSNFGANLTSDGGNPPTYTLADYSNQIIINGPLYIDEDFIFKDCPNVTFGPQAQLIVMPERTLSILGSHLYSGCGDELWKGIYAYDGNSNVIVDNSSTHDCKIENAVHAIDLRYDAQFNIISHATGGNYVTTLDNNHTHLRMKEFKQVSPGLLKQDGSYGIWRTTLTCSSSTLLFPFDIEQTDTAIILNYVKKVAIGNYLDNNSDLFNNINTANTGIYGYKSSFGVYSNNFSNFQFNASSSTPTGNAVFATNGTVFFNGSTDIDKVDVGGNANGNDQFSNNFSNSNGGVVLVNMDANVKFNTFGYPTKVNASVFGFLNLVKKIEIKNNLIVKSDIGIAMDVNASSDITIANNDPIVIDPPLGNVCFGIGIGDFAFSSTNISHNNITSSGQYGIWGQNTSCQLFGTLDNLYFKGFFAFNNNVELPDYPVNHYAIGIYNANSFLPFDGYNCVTGEGHNASNHQRSFTSSFTQGTYLEYNTTDKTYIGFEFLNNSDFSILLANSINAHWYGVQLGSSTIPTSSMGNQDFLIFNKLLGNRYFGHDMLGTFYNTQNNHAALNDVNSASTKFLTSDFDATFLPATPATTHFIILPPDDVTANTELQDCASQFEGPSPALGFVSQDDLEFIAAGDISWDNSNRLFEWSEKKTVYKFLQIDPSLLEGSSVLEDFNDSVESSNIGKFTQLEEDINELLDSASLKSTDFDDIDRRINVAITLNNSISTNYIFESYLQDVYGILLNALSNNDANFSDSEKVEVDEIANQCPQIGGPAVFIARVLRRIYAQPAFYSDSCASSKESASNEQQISNFSLFPNPTTGDLTFLYSLEGNKNADLLISDLTGKTLKRYKLEPSEISIKFTVDQLPAGIYLCQVKQNEHILSVNKFSVIKE